MKTDVKALDIKKMDENIKSKEGKLTEADEIFKEAQNVFGESKDKAMEKEVKDVGDVEKDGASLEGKADELEGDADKILKYKKGFEEVKNIKSMDDLLGLLKNHSLVGYKYNNKEHQDTSKGWLIFSIIAACFLLYKFIASINLLG